jgi:DNA-nicking Smr family endonuclease
LRKKKSSTDAPSKLKTRPSGSKKKNSRVNVDCRTNPNDGRLEHSNRLCLIFEEERRQHLNDLAIKKSAPKQKSSCKVKKQVDESEVVYHNTSCESKAGKTFFPVLIGHEEYLYKSSKASKLSQVSPLSLDLHGCTRDEALFKLSSSLPDWLDAAVKEHPYTLPVNIIAGGGSQIVADAVQHWIRESNVANRF